MKNSFNLQWWCLSTTIMFQSQELIMNYFVIFGQTLPNPPPPPSPKFSLITTHSCNCITILHTKNRLEQFTCTYSVCLYSSRTASLVVCANRCLSRSSPAVWRNCAFSSSSDLKNPEEWEYDTNLLHVYNEKGNLSHNGRSSIEGPITSSAWFKLVLL